MSKIIEDENREKFEYFLKQNILCYVFSKFDNALESKFNGISEVKSFEENAGSFYITLKNGDSYYLQLSKCEE